MTNPINSNQVQNVLDRSYQLLQAGLLKEGFNYVMSELSQVTKNLTQETIDTQVREECLQHPVAKLLLQEPITRWSFQKPRGYSGDAVLIDYIYRLKPCTVADSYIGRELRC